SVGVRVLKDALWGAVLADAIVSSRYEPVGSIANSRVVSAATRWMRSSMVLSGSYVVRVPIPESISQLAVELQDTCALLKAFLIADCPTERSFGHKDDRALSTALVLRWCTAIGCTE